MNFEDAIESMLFHESSKDETSSYDNVTSTEILQIETKIALINIHL